MRLIDADRLWTAVTKKRLDECDKFLETIEKQPSITLPTIPKGLILLTTEKGDKQYFNVDLIVRIQPYYVGGKEKTFLVCCNDDGFVVEESINEVLFLINNARRQS